MKNLFLFKKRSFAGFFFAWLLIINLGLPLDSFAYNTYTNKTTGAVNVQLQSGEVTKGLTNGEVGVYNASNNVLEGSFAQTTNLVIYQPGNTTPYVSGLLNYAVSQGVPSSNASQLEQQVTTNTSGQVTTVSDPDDSAVDAANGDAISPPNTSTGSVNQGTTGTFYDNVQNTNLTYTATADGTRTYYDSNGNALTQGDLDALDASMEGDPTDLSLNPSAASYAASSATTGGTSAITSATTATGAQGITNTAATGGSLGVGSAAVNTLTASGTCSVGAIIGRFISSLISKLVNALFGTVTKTVSGLTIGVADLASHPYQIGTYDPNTVNLLSHLSQKTTGQTDFSISGVATGFIPSPSLDSIMFCIVNEIITYITQATIQWINSGFNGNPVFVQNPQAMLLGIANQEAGNLVHSIAAGGSGGVSMLGPIQQPVATNLIGSYNNSLYTNASLSSMLQPKITLLQPSFSNTSSYNAYYGGQWPKTNGMDTLMMAGNYSSTAFGAGLVIGPANQYRIAAAQQSQKMQFAAGQQYQPFTVCPQGKTRYDGTCDPQYLTTVTTGKQVADQLAARQMMTYTRIAMANSFDAIVTSLVNELIKIGVNDLFQGKVQVNGATQGSTVRTQQFTVAGSSAYPNTAAGSKTTINGTTYVSNGVNGSYAQGTTGSTGTTGSNPASEGTTQSTGATDPNPY